MVANPKHLNNVNVHKISAKIAKQISKRAVDIALTMHSSLIAPASEGGTPVKTGWLRSNWIINRNRNYVGTVGSKQAVDNSVMEASRQRIKTYDIRKARSIFISNNVFYRDIVNYTYGYFFIEKAKQRAKAKFGEFTEKVRL